MGGVVGFGGLAAIMAAWYLFRRWQEIGKVERQPVIVQVEGREYRVAFTVRATVGRWGGPLWLLFSEDTMRASIDGRSGDEWQHIGERSLPFNFGYSGRWETNNSQWDGDRLTTLAAQLAADVLNPPRWPRDYR